MSARPSISVVVAAYNEERWIAATLESALAQDPEPLEVIVVDDGSSDGTAEVASSYGGVTVVSQQNEGLAGARNTGAARAKGDAIMFLDADDSLEPAALAALSRVAQGVPGWGAIVPNYLRVWPERARIAWANAPATRVLGRSALPGLIRRNWLQSNALVRPDVWREHPYREHMLKDLDLWFRLIFAGIPIVAVGSPLVRVTAARPQSLTARTAFVRANRRRTFSWVWEREDLSPLERSLVAYQLARTSAGEVAARASAGELGPREAVGSLAADSNPVVRRTMRAMRLPGVLAIAEALDRGPRRT